MARSRWPDAADDDAGDLWAYARQLALGGVDAPAARLRLHADFPEVGDDELSAVIRGAFAVPTAFLNAPAPAPTNSVQTAPDWGSERLMAELLAAGPLSNELRFVPDGPESGWRKWDESYWSPCNEPVPLALAAAVHEAAGHLLRCGQLDLRTARSMESTASMRAILAQLQAHPSMRIDPEKIDPPHWLAVRGGLLDLRTWKLQPARPSGPVFLHRCAVGYDITASHPLWDEVVGHVDSLPDGAVVQRYLGASLAGVPPDRKLLILLGSGGDGKGCLLRSCLAVMGQLGTVLPNEALSGDGRGAHGHEILSGISRARLAYSSEVPSHLDWDLLKSLSGGDPRTSKRLHGRAFEVQPRIWLSIATNSAPVVPDQAAADRCILVRWSKPADPNPEISALLATPGPDRDAYLRACLRWMADGCRAFQAEGLGVPDFAKPTVEPEGLPGWWDDMLTSERLVLGRGWTPFQPIAVLAVRWFAEHGLQPPSTTALGTFLRSRLASRRALDQGRKITLYPVDVVGRG